MNFSTKSWTIHCLKIYRMLAEAMKFIDETFKKWKVEITVGVESLAEVKIQKGIFQ